jgi:hypothetical protein
LRAITSFAVGFSREALWSSGGDRCGVRRARLTGAAFVAVLLVAAGGLCASARAAASPTRVTISNSRIEFAPGYAPSGSLVFTVVNRTSNARDFRIGALRTAAIAPGHSATLTAVLPGTGDRPVSSVATAGSQPSKSRLTGTLYLYEPCTHPSTTTVDVSIASAGGLTLSQTSVPCGTVTFMVTDVDRPATSLLVSIVVPPRSGVTDQLNPGGTATMTVRFAAKTVVNCDAVQDDSAGDSLVVGHASLTLS